jgi:hypothetical protein
MRWLPSRWQARRFWAQDGNAIGWREFLRLVAPSTGPSPDRYPSQDSAHVTTGFSLSEPAASTRTPPFSRIDIEVQMFSNRYRYRKNAEESLDRARHARKSEDTDAWLAIAEDWIRLAVESEAVEPRPRRLPER